MIALGLRRTAVLLLFQASVALAGTPAGSVLMAIGPVWAETNGQRTPLERGQQVDVGQNLITLDGGHLYVRMRDGGLVTLRPNSVLEIEVFDYEPGKPEAGKVRYSLRRGVARSVTGAIGEANKDAFRFNTPVAAIGVRGTDFVTFSDTQTTRVSVKSGAVVVSALNDICRAEGFGACLDHAIALRAGNSNSYIEVNRHERTPRLLQDSRNMTPDRMSPPNPDEPVASLQENRINNALNEQSRQTPKIDVRTPAPVVDIGMNDVHWGRWSGTYPGVSGATVRELLAAKKDIQVVSSLFGMGVTQLPERLPERWQAEFKLTGGDAYVVSNNIYTKAELGGGNLKIDMAAKQFTANAKVIENVNTHSIDAIGVVDFRGYLESDPTKSNSQLHGVVNANLKTVGSVFEKPVGDGRSLTGTMVWHR
jgi:hypothetical protein